MSVSGIGGVFFKCRDPAAMRRWYNEHLGFTSDENGDTSFQWREPAEGGLPGRRALTTWAPFLDSTDCFQPSHKPFMIRYRTRDLDDLTQALHAAGEAVDREVREQDDGRFAWVMDPEGGRVELWEPPATAGAPQPLTGPVTGLGGVFFKSENPVALKSWYATRLGVTPDSGGYVSFRCLEMDGRAAFTAWEAFPADTDYFDPSDKPFMFNYRVRDLKTALARLQSSGIDVEPRIQEYEYGKFGWIMDPEGHRIELWEPPLEPPA